MNEIRQIRRAAEPSPPGRSRAPAKSTRPPKGRADIRVPFREIALSDPNEAPVRVYDPPAPTRKATSPSISPAGCRRCARLDRGAGLRDRRSRARSSPRTTAMSRRTALRRSVPAERTLRAGKPGQLVTQLEFARAGSSPKR